MSRIPSVPSSSRIAFAIVLAVASAAPASAATRVWPVVIGPGCNGSLQQCIDGAAAGDTVRIVADDVFLPDAYTAVDEEIVIGKSLTLEAAPGIDAMFANGRSLLVETPASGAISVTLRRLVIQGGNIRVFHRTSADASYTLDRIRIEETFGGPGECAIDLNDRGTGSPSFVVGDGTLRFHARPEVTPGGICVNGDGGAWQVSLFRNYVQSDVGSLFSGISIAGTSAGNVDIGANQLHVHGTPRGIVVSQNEGSAPNVLSIHDNLVTGQDTSAASTEAALRVNPTNTELRIVNNTFARNRNGLRINYRDGASGRVANNIVAFHTQVGLDIDPRHALIANSHNLIFGNGSDEVFIGPGTIGVDPQFVSRFDFRLRQSSPARDGGNNADVATLFGTAFDADGEKRIANGTVDMGALEWIGDVSVRHVATAENALFNTTRLEGLGLRGTSERLVLTPLRGGATTAELQETLGVYQENIVGFGYYLAFHEDFNVPFTPGRRIHAYLPVRGATGFLHTSTSASVVDSFSRISHPELDSRPAAIAIVTHNWNPDGGTGVYHDHHLGLDYVAPNWFVGNQDADTMLSARNFNLLVAPLGSPNAFVRETGSNARAELRLEHPLLDGNGCATPQVGRVGAVRNDTAFTLDYRAGAGGAPGHWFIVAEGAGATFPAGTAFNVIVPGLRANACRIVPLFRDGFD